MRKKTLSSIKHFLILLIVFVFSLSSIAQPNWNYTNTGTNHIVLFQSSAVVTINGIPINPGDYIGAFYDSLGFLGNAGYSEWTDSTIAITVWGNSYNSSTEDGFLAGELIKWKIWSNSLNMVFDAIATYNPAFPNQETYLPNGMSEILTLMTSTSIYPSVNQPSCYGFADGSIDLSINYGTGPYTFNWSNGATSQNLSNLVAGTFSVTVTDALSVNQSLTIQVPEPDELLASILINEDSAFMCMAHAQVFPTGGTQPYTYLWNDPQTQITQIAELCPGLYNVTYTDSHNCQANSDVIVDASSVNVIDSAFTLIDTCLLTSMPDTAYISDLIYSNGYMIIEWTIEMNGYTFTMHTSYPTITSPGLYYVGLVVNCPTKYIPSITFVSIYDIKPEVFSIENESKNIFSCTINPNPIIDKLNLTINNSKSNLLKVGIYNSIGVKVFESDIELNANHSQTVSLPELAPGIYFAEIFNDFNQSVIVKFVK